jgi:hypothetical protein
MKFGHGGIRRNFKLRFGREFSARTRKGKDAPMVLMDFLQAVTGRQVESIEGSGEADLLLLSALDLRDLLEERANHSAVIGSPAELDDFAKSVANGGRLLVVSFENLQHAAWARFGSLLMQSKVPRLTFFPSEIDPTGERFPYWWNYLDWPDLARRRAVYRRYGRLYSLARLMEPIRHTEGRLERACWVGSNDDAQPRKFLRALVDANYGLDVFGPAGEPFEGPKLEILARYKFSLAAENSFGFGYDSEKVPEVWDAGCVPVGGFPQPYSDFNPKVLDLRNPEASFSEPLLLRPPNPDRVLQYLDRLVN